MIKSKPSTKEYRDNYDRTFRSGPPLYVDFHGKYGDTILVVAQDNKIYENPNAVFKDGAWSLKDEEYCDIPDKYSVADPDPIKLKETGKTLIIKTMDGDIALG